MRIDLSALDGAIGFIADGVAEQDRSGLAVGGAGDINADGVADIVIGAYAADPGGRSAAGDVYVIFGSLDPFPARLRLADLDGANGFTLHGAARGDRTGYVVTSAGDLNADGVDDLAIGAYTASPGGGHFAGTAYVVFGHDDGFAAEVELSALNGLDGVRLHGGGAEDLFGGAINSAGDVNGDGVPDLIVGAMDHDRIGGQDAGAAFVLYGGGDPFPADIFDADITKANGFAINGGAAEDRAGTSVDGVGDVNQDGVDDVVVGAYLIDPAGRADAGGAYVVFGRSGLRPNLDLASAAPGDAVLLAGAADEDYAGWSVAGAGDVNGDGVPDILVGAFRSDAGALIDAGAVHVVFGRAGPWPDRIDLGALNGADGFTIHGEGRLDKFGLSVSAAGDFNHDGLSDIIVGAYASDPNGKPEAGRSYVVYGRSDGVASLDVAALTDADGVVFEGIDVKDFSGFSVAGAGDVNGDGNDDVVIGGRLADPNGEDSGETYVVFGHAAPRPSGSAFNDVLFSSAGADTLDGLGGTDTASYAGAAAGVRVDLGVAAPQATGGGGRDLLRGIENIEGSAFDDVLTGDRSANQLRGGEGRDGLYGEGGDDYLTGAGGADVAFGALGDDVLLGGDAADRLWGGGGDDRLLGGDDGDVLFGDAGADTLLGGAGYDRLYGGSGDDELNGGDGLDFLDGSSGSDVYDGGAGADRLSSRLDGAQDSFVFDIGSGADRIYRYEAGVDRIGLGEAYGFANGQDAIDGMAGATFNAAGDVILNLNGADVIQMIGFASLNPGVAIADLAADIFVY